MYFRVLWRFRLVVLAGFILACVLSLSTYLKVSIQGGKPSISYRQSETWHSTTLLGLTQGGFPWGRAIIPFNTQHTATGTQVVPSNFADPSRFAALSGYYSRLANSDAVQASAARRKHVPGNWTAQPIVDPKYNYSQPFIQFDGYAPDPRAAVTLANLGAAAFREYMVRQQNAAGIPQAQRVALYTVNKARGAVLFAGRRKTTPVVLFLTIMLAAIGLAFILENLRPRVRLVAEQSEDQEHERRMTGQRSA